MQKPKRVKTTLYIPEAIWKATRIKAIEMNLNATDLVVQALQQFLKKAGARA